MITPREIMQKSITPEKRESSKHNFFAFYIGRPLSCVLTVPFLYTKLTPNTISIISIILCVVGFLMMGAGKSMPLLLVGWCFFFLWNLMDGVDGNVARYREQYSSVGEIYDAISGYTALALIFFACGWAASNQFGIISHLVFIPPETYLVLGALSGIFTLFPRLVMHKALTSLNDEKVVLDATHKSDYGKIRVFVANLTSPAGFIQLLMLIAILFHLLDLFTLAYFFLNLAIMIVSIRNILHTGK